MKSSGSKRKTKRINRKWTQAEDRFIQSNRQLTAYQLGKALGRSADSAKRRRMQLGSYSLISRPWTQEEDEYLLRFANRPAKVIAKELNRSVDSIRCRRVVLKHNPNPKRQPPRVSKKLTNDGSRAISAPEEAKVIAHQMGLTIRVYVYPAGGISTKNSFLWMVLHNGKELGSWVPKTGSARIGTTMHSGLANFRDMLKLFGKLVGERTI